MARLELRVGDPANRVVVHTLLKTAGHEIVSDEPDVVITDDIQSAPEIAALAPTLVLAKASSIRDAVRAMQKGVYGYIFVPLQPGEVEIMVQRALAATEKSAPAKAPPVRQMEEIEVDHIRAVLRECKGNRTKAARVLGIGRNTIWRKLRDTK